MDLVNELKKEQALLVKRLNAIEVLLEYFGDSDSTVANVKPMIRTKFGNSQKEDYSDNWSLRKKFLYLLKENGRFLHFREAAKMIIDKEGTDLDTKSLASKLSAATAPFKREGKLVKFNIGGQNQNTFWGIPDWLNDDGSIKTGHEYNKEYLSHRKVLTDDLFDNI
jgi:hypothetical protein